MEIFNPHTTLAAFDVHIPECEHWRAICCDPEKYTYYDSLMELVDKANFEAICNDIKALLTIPEVRYFDAEGDDVYGHSVGIFVTEKEAVLAYDPKVPELRKFHRKVIEKLEDNPIYNEDIFAEYEVDHFWKHTHFMLQNELIGTDIDPEVKSLMLLQADDLFDEAHQYFDDIDYALLKYEPSILELLGDAINGLFGQYDN